MIFARLWLLWLTATAKTFCVMLMLQSHVHLDSDWLLSFNCRSRNKDGGRFLNELSTRNREKFSDDSDDEFLSSILKYLFLSLTLSTYKCRTSCCLMWPILYNARLFLMVVILYNAFFLNLRLLLKI